MLYLKYVLGSSRVYFETKALNLLPRVKDTVLAMDQTSHLDMLHSEAFLVSFLKALITYI